MRAVTLKDAKARLNELVGAAELAPRLTDAQAQRLWRQLAEERARGSVLEFKTSEAAVEYLTRGRRDVPAARRRRKDHSRRRGCGSR